MRVLRGDSPVCPITDIFAAKTRSGGHAEACARAAGAAKKKPQALKACLNSIVAGEKIKGASTG
jgi:hypothetical protein